MPYSVGPALVSFVGRKRVAGDAGAEDFGAMIASVRRASGSSRRTDRDRANRLSASKHPNGGSCGLFRR